MPRLAHRHAGLPLAERHATDIGGARLGLVVAVRVEEDEMTVRIDGRAHLATLEFDNHVDRDDELEIVFDYEMHNIFIDRDGLAAIARAFGCVLVPLPTEPPAR